MPNKYQETASSLATNTTVFVTIKTNLKLLLASFSLRIFGNSLGWKINFLYFCHHLWSKFSTKAEGGNTEAASLQLKVKELRQKGFTKLGPFNVEELSKFVFDEFQKTPIQNSMAFLSKDNLNALAEPLFKFLLRNVQPLLLDYYGSYVQPYWTNIMRYVEGDRAPDSSFGYHTDDNPKQLLKIFIYLNDTSAVNGAFRTFDYTVSNKLIQKGFISLTPELRIKSQKLIDTRLENECLNILEGKQGTILIFDNNLIHKGTLPQKGYRDVICVEVYPSNKQWTISDISISLQTPIKYDYPKNPFHNDILNPIS